MGPCGCVSLWKGREWQTNFTLIAHNNNSAGKYMIFRRLLGREPLSIEPTVDCADFCTVPFDHGGIHQTVQVWNTCGQEQHPMSSRLYFHGADAVMLVYDASDHQSFDGLRSYFEIAQEVLGKTPAVFYVIGLISDTEQVQDHVIEAWCDNHGYTHITCCARTADNLQQIFDSILMDAIRIRYSAHNTVTPKPVNEHLKLILIGPSGCGKDTIARRLSKNNVDVPYKPTVGVDFCTVPFDCEGVHQIVEVWDTAGQEQHAKLSRLYFHGANAALLVYDLSDRQSFGGLRAHFEMAQELLDTKSVLFFVVGNKSDLEEVVDEHVVKKWCADHEFRFMKCSAKTGDNVQQIFDSVVREAITHRKNSPGSDAVTISTKVNDAHRGLTTTVDLETGCC
ncbi:Rab family protein [Pelomyxa schiedti]|nr:Rab family protein [Pelomyxa schiedti]